MFKTGVSEYNNHLNLWVQLDNSNCYWLFETQVNISIRINKKTPKPYFCSLYNSILSKYFSNPFLFLFFTINWVHNRHIFKVLKPESQDKSNIVIALSENYKFNFSFWGAQISFSQTLGFNTNKKSHINHK